MTLVDSFLSYKKGKRNAYYYAKGYFLILMSFIIQILKSPLKPGSPFDILGLIMVIIFLLAGLHNIFFLSKKEK
ncbi:MAG: hypothetical protein ABH952_05490 [Candidatus Omnitrophota bacterium]